MSMDDPFSEDYSMDSYDPSTYPWLYDSGGGGGGVDLSAYDPANDLAALFGTSGNDVLAGYQSTDLGAGDVGLTDLQPIDSLLGSLDIGASGAAQPSGATITDLTPQNNWLDQLLQPLSLSPAQEQAINQQSASPISTGGIFSKIADTVGKLLGGGSSGGVPGGGSGSGGVLGNVSGTSWLVLAAGAGLIYLVAKQK